MQSHGGSDPQVENHWLSGLQEGQYLGLNSEPHMLDKHYYVRASSSASRDKKYTGGLMEVMCEYSAIQLRDLSICGFEYLGGIQSQLPVLRVYCFH